MIIILLSTIIGAFLVNYVYRVSRLLYHLGKLPGPPNALPLFGNVSALFTTPEKIFIQLREWSRVYYPVYNLRVIHLPTVTVVSPEDAELILSNPVHIEKSPIYLLLSNWLKTGLLTSGGEKWQTRRKILTPAFHFSILQQFVKVFNEETEILVDALKQECSKPFIDISDNIVKFTLKTIAETAMGTRLTFTTKKEQTYKQSIIELGEILLFRLIHTWYAFPFIFCFHPLFYKERKLTRNLHNFTAEVIVERQKNFKEIDLPLDEHDVYIGKKRLAMLDLLLMAKNKDGLIDDKGIQEEVDTFMFEGHDTTAAAIGFILMLIACHRNVQDQIYQELVDILGDVHKQPSYNDLQEMKLLERVIKESLRLYPSVHFISRVLGEDMTTHNGYFLPKDTVILMHIYDIHHNPDIYPNPEKFDPDRFLPENSKDRHPFAYLPFSAGSRNCIGQRFALLELKAAVCGILANFILEPVDTPQSIVLVVDIVLRTKEGIKIKFSPRA